MEFNEKLQQLRRQRGLTQEELAAAIYVSRTAVSKWESGRGYPSIDSLKAIAAFFSVTIDELLSGEETLALAEEDIRQKTGYSRDMVFALLDISCAALLFLPLFAQRAQDAVYAVSLISLTETALYMQVAYFAAVLGNAAWGILTLALQNCSHALLKHCKTKISLALNAAGMLLFILGLQPYAAVFMFIFLMIKVIMLTKKR